MSAVERYADELVDLVRSGPAVPDGLVRFEQVFDAHMIEAPGVRRQAKGAPGELAALIDDRLGGMP
jgi:hypothetical protein